MGKSIEEEVVDLRQATREAHEAMQGMRDLIREVKAVTAEARTVADEVFSERMSAQVEAGLASYRESINTAIENATQAVYARFDTITDLMLGESKGQRREGLTPLSEYATQIGQERAGGGT